MSGKRITAIILAAITAFFAVFAVPGAGEVHAAYPVFVRIYLDGQWKMDLTDSISTLNGYIKKNKSKAIRLEMLTDWNAAAQGRADDFDNALTIPSGARVTLDMHGHVINRDNGWSDSAEENGEVIRVENGATLTVNGGSEAAEKAIEHKSVPVYTSAAKGSKPTTRISAYGGTIMGGVSISGGGGLHILSGCAVTLNDVTIAGNCSRDTFWNDNGYGGAIWLYDDDSRLTLNNCLITGCMSDDRGGAICVNNDDKFLIELNNTIIEKNYAAKKGGGIYLGGEAVHINGTGETYVRNNQSSDGGGIYMEDQNESASGFTLSGNKATNGAGLFIEGGEGIIMNSPPTLTDLTIQNNNATERGGGIYIKGNYATISSCEITGNVANTSGGGVYVNEKVNLGFSVKGATVIKENDGRMMGDNLYISDNTPENTRVMFNVTKGAEVWMSYYNLGNRTKVMVTEGKQGDQKKSPNCIKYLHADNQGFHFTFNSKPNSRKIFFVKDGHDSADSGEPVPQMFQPATIAPADAINMGEQVSDHGSKAGIVDTVGPGGGAGNKYNLIRGFSRHQETDSDTHDAAVAFYYSDAFFDDDYTCSPDLYNEHLASASINMAYAGMYLRAKEPEDANGNYYYNRHGGARQFMADIGCPDQNIYVNDSNEKKPGTDTIGVTIASKNLAESNGYLTGKILIPIVTRGGGYELEWASNGTLKKASEMQERGKELEAAGFSNAADQVMDEVEKYIQKYNLQDAIKEGRVKFWIAGYSRGGATANLTAKRLLETYCYNADGSPKHEHDGNINQVYAYTCEAPMGGSDEAELLTDKTKYYSIHNMINDVDVVPLVAPGLMGFKRYGVDHYIPGTAAANVTGKQETVTRTGAGRKTRTTYRDNERILLKQLDSKDPLRRESMLEQLRLVDSGLVLDDYYHPLAIKIIPPGTYESGNYDNNHIEEMVKDFLRFAQEGIPDKSWSQTIPNRDSFVDNLQPAIRDMLAMVFGMDPEEMDGFSGRAGTIIDRLPGIAWSTISMYGIYARILQVGWHNLSDSEKQHFKTGLWEKFKETGALEFLSKEDAVKLEKHWPALLNFAFSFVESDYNYHPGPISSWAGGADPEKDILMLLGSFATYSTFILQNHYPEVNLAWARAYDTYYDFETKEYETLYQEKAAAGYRVAIPAAKGKDSDQTDKQLAEGSEKSNSLVGDQRIILENENIVGEAVYYDLFDNDSGKQLTKNLLYRGGIDLALGTANERNYTIKTYDISYGVRSSVAVYHIKLVTDKHTVRIGDGTNENTYSYKEGEKVTIAAVYPPEGQYFLHWVVQLFDSPDAETPVSEISDSLLGSEKNNPNASFVMPKAGGMYADHYALRIAAVCSDRVSEVTAGPASPTAGEPLSETTTLAVKAGEANWVPKHDDIPIQYDIHWTYSYEKGEETITVPASGIAYDATEYTATITVEQSIADALVFVPTGRLIGRYGGEQSKIKEGGIRISRNDADGSATLSITFVPTGESGQHVRPDVDLDLNIRTVDLNMAEDPQYEPPVGAAYSIAQGGEAYTLATIAAPEVENEVFTGWELTEKPEEAEYDQVYLAPGEDAGSRVVNVMVPTTSAPSYDINALYIPVITEIKVNLDAPEGGKPMQTEAFDAADPTAGKAETLKVMISNEYTIDKGFVEINWSPQPAGDDQHADYLTNYTVTVKVVPQEDADGSKYVIAKDAAGIAHKISAMFCYSENPVATVNGNKAFCNTEANSVSYTFPMTTYKFDHVESPSDISDVAHGTSYEKIAELLPETATIVMEDGTELLTELNPGTGENGWTINDSPMINPPDRRSERVLMASQVVTLPDYVTNDEGKQQEVIVRVNVNEADTALVPEASMKSDSFLYDQQTTLSTEEEGGTIYYTFDTGAEPAFTEYSGGEIDIKRDDPHAVDETTIDDQGREVKTGRKVLYLQAYTAKEGKWESTVVTYQYIFTNEVPVPEGNDYEYTGEPQIGVYGSPFYTLEPAGKGVTINEEGDAVATEPGTYQVTAKIKEGFRWRIEDPETDEDSYSEEDQLIAFEITKEEIPTKEYTITYDLNGGRYKGREENIVVKAKEGSVIPVHEAPVRDGYTFLYWKGSKYQPGDTYKVSGDHTFTAQWKKNKKPNDGKDETKKNVNKDKIKTGDTNSLLLWVVLFLAAAVLALNSLLFLRRFYKD